MFEILKGKRVFLTGHTGFKGAWMLQLLHHFGAQVKGYALAAENEDLYTAIQGDQYCYASVIADINDYSTLHGELIRFEPDIVIHMAAQALVRESYWQPVETFATNVMGTVHVLDTIRQLEKSCIGLMITTDKVYENLETGKAFTESDALGGYDPYSASKAAAEIAIASYRNSFFSINRYAEHQKSISSVRAGNVIGGGDFAKDRIIPDIVRAIQRNQAVYLRNPNAIRPWQHVLEPLIAYLKLIVKQMEEPEKYAAAYNIGPEATDTLKVKDVAELFIEKYGQGRIEIQADGQFHEAQQLTLDNQKIKSALQWNPVLNAKEAIEWTASWYADVHTPANEKCMHQIDRYLNKIKNKS